MLTRVSNFTTYTCLIIVLIHLFSMFTEEDGNTINNEDRKEFYIRKILKEL